MAKIFIFSNKGEQITYNFSAPLRNVVVNKGIAVVDDEKTADVLSSILEQTCLGMYQVEDYDPAIHGDLVGGKQSLSVAGNQANITVQGILGSAPKLAPLASNPAIDYLDNALAQALTQGQDAVNELVASNPEALEGAGFVAPNSGAGDNLIEPKATAKTSVKISK